jgi:hypothetical protein
MGDPRGEPRDMRGPPRDFHDPRQGGQRGPGAGDRR